MKWGAQFPSIDQVRELQALGFPQDTAFHWTVGGEDLDVFAIVEWNEDAAQVASKICAAPTVAEMGEWLRASQNPSRYVAEYFDREEPDWSVAMYLRDGTTCSEEEGATEAEARAQLLIALAKAKLIDPRKLLR